jgi:hypothetical protein
MEPASPAQFHSETQARHGSCKVRATSTATGTATCCLNPLTHQTENWLMNGTQVVSMQTPVSGGLAAPQSAPPGLSATLIYYPATLLTASSADAQRMVGGSGQIEILTGTDSGATGPVLARS